MVIMTIILMERKNHNMIDIHSHIIPGIDDGARDEAETLSLLRMAQDDGTTHIVATPHINIGRFDNDQVCIMNGLALLKRIINENNLTIQVAILLEFPHSHIPPGSDNFIKWLFNNGYRPIIAHPERNRDLLRSPSLLAPFIRLGCLTQVTAGSITGKFGPEVKTFAFELLKQNKVTVVASDAHNIKRRPPILSEAYNFVAHEFGEDKAIKLFKLNPQAITQTLFNEN